MNVFYIEMLELTYFGFQSVFFRVYFSWLQPKASIIRCPILYKKGRHLLVCAKIILKQTNKQTWLSELLQHLPG